MDRYGTERVKKICSKNSTKMRFEIATKSNIMLKAPEFLCDSVIHKQIEYPLPNRPFFMTIVGSAGSGKTSLAITLLNSRQAYKRVFDSVHVVMPSHSVGSLKNNIFENHDKMHNEIDEETLESILDHVKGDAEDGLNSLLLIDDCAAALKDKHVQRLLKTAIYNRRHYRLSIICLVQSYNSMPLAVRKTISHLIMFKPRNKREYANIFEELIYLDRDTADRLMEFIFDEPYSFLFANTDAGIICKNFDSITITN